MSARYHNEYELQCVFTQSHCILAATLMPLMPVQSLYNHNMIAFHVCGIINAFEKQQKLFFRRGVEKL